MRTLVDDLLEEQSALPAAERFALWHEENVSQNGRYAALLPATPPDPGQQYAFEVDLDSCTGCKSCVVACHSLNGLAEAESWRSTGTLVSTDWRVPLRQTITTSCHHCLDPACAEGCPTLAYEKDQATGIVRHLDDQCIGCSYCTMTCPYEVPQFDSIRGIVRKCDMCRQRLEVGEAPACVQSCPNGAIRIVLVDKERVRNATRLTSLLPTAPPSNLTAPSTRFVSGAPLPSRVAPDRPGLSPQPAHLPLVAMLILTQWGVGALTAGWIAQHSGLAAMGAALSLSGALAATLHLGRPLQAWRAWMGWRGSWLSREIIVFGMHGPFAAAYALWPYGGLGALAAATGVAGVVCSGMVYHVTRRDWWRGPRSLARFLLTTAMLGAATASAFGLPAQWPFVVFALLKLAFEARWLACEDPDLADEASPAHSLREWALARSVRLLETRFGLLNRGRFSAGLAAVLLAPLPWAALALSLAAEIAERFLFFRAVAPPRMPGWTTNQTT